MLRPLALQTARKAFFNGDIGRDALTAVEDEAIRHVVDIQQQAGLRAISDGEQRRTFFHVDFLEKIGGVKADLAKYEIKFRGGHKDVTLVPPAGLMPKVCIDPNALPALYAKLISDSVKLCPADMAIRIHLCRGNHRSAWAAEGGYEPVADIMFNECGVDTFFLEYDDARSGDFSPLRFVPKGKSVVLGVVCSKTPVLESKEAMRKRIEEATQYIALDQLCLSPQCGFASTHEGNDLSEAEQLAKLQLVVELASEIWQD